MARRLASHWIKVGVAGLAAAAAVAGARALTAPPPLTPVAVVQKPVAALAPITAADLRWVPMEHPPAGVITEALWHGDPLAAQALPAGTVLTAVDLTTAAQAVGLKPGEVQYVVTITPASAVIRVGQRVDLWTLPGGASSNGTNTAGAPTELAVGVRVIGLYTQNAQPVGAASAGGGLLSPPTTSGTPALAALAVPAYAVPQLMAENPSQTVLLVHDPTMTRFALVSSAPPPASAPTSPIPASKTPAKP